MSSTETTGWFVCLCTYRANTKIYEYFQLDGSVWPLRNARSRLNLQRIPTNLSPIRGRPGRPNKRTRAPWRDFPYLFKYLRFRCPERRFVKNSAKSPPRHQQTRRFPLDDLPDGINVVVSRRAGANEGLPIASPTTRLASVGENNPCCSIPRAVKAFSSHTLECFVVRALSCRRPG
jgi:hypothetical protein